jgi:hypothetical protein
MDGWMYVGASLAGFPLGWWLDTYGLSSGIALLGLASLVFGLLAIGIRRPNDSLPEIENALPVEMSEQVV